MIDRDCVQFLQWSLPALKMRWQGFRRVRRQVCKRIEQRMLDLHLANIEAYRTFLTDHPEEWQVLDSLCPVTISRFYRDRMLFQFLEHEVLPAVAREALARGDKELRCWNIGCASGEEPYTVALLRDFVVAPLFPSLLMTILATDLDRNMIHRARKGCYGASSLRELPREWKARAFLRQGELFCIRREIREKVNFLEQDIRKSMPEGLFHLIFCRNIAFTYFDAGLQKHVLVQLADRMIRGGALVIGIHENLPESHELAPWPAGPGVFRKS